LSFFNVAFNAGAIAAVNLLTIKPLRSMAGFTADAVLEEAHNDDLTITDHPVETGSTISDHAFKMPAEVTLTYGWSAANLAAYGNPDYLQQIYQQLLLLQSGRVMFDIYTGKRYYPNMMLRNVSTTTNSATENNLIIRASCREIILAQTQTVTTGNSQNQATPDKNGDVGSQVEVNAVPAQSINVSALRE